MYQPDKIISAVQSHKPLWDIRDKQYHSRDIQRQLWAKVAKEVGSDVRTVKKKWKGLRDSFRRENKKHPKPGQVSTWPFYAQMRFLSDIMEPRKLKGNRTEEMSRSLDDSTNIEATDFDVIFCDMQGQDCCEQETQETTPASSASSSTQMLNTDGSSKKRSRPDDHDAKFGSIECTAMKDDSDNQFLQSLLPFLKKVPDHRKLIVRHNLLHVLIDEQETQHM